MPENAKKIYLFGNWKMYLNYSESVAFAEELAEAADHFGKNIKMAVFPSNLALAAVSDILATSKIDVGGQNVYWVDKGGYTGEVSAAMIGAAGAAYALVGHSERRHMFHESNHDVHQKMEGVLSAGLTPILCVGETKIERERNETQEVVEAQLRAAYDNITWPEGTELVVAYEPVWAIGTGETATPVDAEKMAAKIGEWLKVLVPGVEPKMLYGGSVKSENVERFISEPHVSGVLVGGASAKRESWLAIAEACGE